MKAFVLAAALVLSAAPAAFAQSATAAANPRPPSAENLAIAHRILEANGGATAMRAQMDAMTQGMTAMMKNMPSFDTALQKDLMDFAMAQEKQAIPQLMEDAASAYAQNLTSDELKAMLEWSRSPVGKSIQSKMPAITQQILASQAPHMRSMARAIGSHVVDLICQQQHCTADQKRQLDQAMAKQFGDQT